MRVLRVIRGSDGGEYSSVTGLLHFGARYYDPASGRWVTRDPIGFQGGDPNLFRFVKNQPSDSIDLLGLFSIPGLSKSYYYRITTKSYIDWIASNMIVGPNAIGWDEDTKSRLRGVANEWNGHGPDHPIDDSPDQQYRFYTRKEFWVTCGVNKILSWRTLALSWDVGLEGPFAGVGQVVTDFATQTDDDTIGFFWKFKARPSWTAEQLLQIVHSRTSVWIWHTIAGHIQCDAQRRAWIYIGLGGSMFPTHKYWIYKINDDGSVNKYEWPRAKSYFSYLWVSGPGDGTMVT